jgi:micrococcal nuclease
MKYLIILFLFVSCTSKVTKVFDGDTILVNHSVIRLAGIDCPELSQPFGQKARQKTVELCLGKQVKIVKMGRDKYNRILANVFVGKISLNNELLRLGYAWHYSYYDHSKKRAKIEAETRINKLGLWSDKNPVAPWDYRHKN